MLTAAVHTLLFRSAKGLVLANSVGLLAMVPFALNVVSHATSCGRTTSLQRQAIPFTESVPRNGSGRLGPYDYELVATPMAG